MKTKEISFDAIQQIKKNNKLMEQLATIEEIVSDIYYNHPDAHKMRIANVKKDIADFGEDFESDYNAESFLYSIIRFANDNQNALIETSQNLIK